MAQNITIAGTTYYDVPSISVPKSGGGSASFVDTSDATATASKILEGYTAYGSAGTKITGTASGGGSGGEPTSVKIIFATDSNGFILLTDTAEILTASGVSF